ncbi:hypothetical protein KKF91_01640 [Myxococcota bacterium]|nr:hypothetical protein [Myxococcota bacterium]MBU1429238.1 hypothetical protein [Myxococcota bacterium]MBU1896615.1 hypothetical protein [Myxococcota bacterium]
MLDAKDWSALIQRLELHPLQASHLSAKTQLTFSRRSLSVRFTAGTLEEAEVHLAVKAHASIKGAFRVVRRVDFPPFGETHPTGDPAFDEAFALIGDPAGLMLLGVESRALLTPLMSTHQVCLSEAGLRLSGEGLAALPNHTTLEALIKQLRAVKAQMEALKRPQVVLERTLREPALGVRGMLMGLLSEAILTHEISTAEVLPPMRAAGVDGALDWFLWLVKRDQSLLPEITHFGASALRPDIIRRLLSPDNPRTTDPLAALATAGVEADAPLDGAATESLRLIFEASRGSTLLFLALCRALGGSSKPGPAARALLKLSPPSYDEEIAQLMALGRTGSRIGEAYLIRALEDGNDDARLEACVGLERCGGLTAIPALRKASRGFFVDAALKEAAKGAIVEIQNNAKAAPEGSLTVVDEQRGGLSPASGGELSPTED